MFHSKDVVTLLENAGVSENVCADLVGHEKPRITYGLYSGGASLEVKRAALAKLQYLVTWHRLISPRLCGRLPSTCHRGLYVA